MNYKKVYNQLVARAKNRIIEGYTERHHIKPICMGGNNHPDNLVDFTAREHFLAHWLLHEIYPDNHKLRYAFWAMFRKSNGQCRYTPSSRVYEYAKHQMLEIWQKSKPSESQMKSVVKSITGTKWYHKPNGDQLRAHSDDPRIKEDGWVLGRFNGSEIANSANVGKRKKYKGKNPPTTSNKQCSIDGVIYESALEAANKLGVNEYTMRYRLTYLNNGKYKNWNYVN